MPKVERVDILDELARLAREARRGEHFSAYEADLLVAARAAAESWRERAERSEAENARLREALGSLRRTLEDFVRYYEIPRNHPDAELILAECRKVWALLEGKGA